MTKPDNYQRLRSLCQRLADSLRRRRLTPEEKALLSEADAALTTGAGRPRLRTLDEMNAAIKEHGSVVAAAKALGITPDAIYKAKRRSEQS